MNTFTRTIAFATSFACLGISVTTHSADTDIYVGANITDATTPNVLFVLDTSGSMDNQDGTGQTRLERMQDALTAVLSSSSNINAGLMRFHNEGGPVLYPLSDIDGVVPVTQVDTDITSTVSDGDDDAEQSLTDNSVTLDDTHLEMIEVGATAAAPTLMSVAFQPQASSDDAEDSTDTAHGDNLISPDLDLDADAAGIRFPLVTIPPGATIVNARLVLTARNNGSGTIDVEIRGQDSDDSTTFVAPTSTDMADANRPRTAALVPWANFSNLSANEVTTSPQLRSIVQEIVDRTGWASGNALTLLTRPTSDSGGQEIYSFDGTTDLTKRPTLVVQYIDGLANGYQIQVENDSDDAEEIWGSNRTGSSDLDLGQYPTGVRFRGVSIPQGATILYADLEFEVQDERTADTSLTITGEDEDSASGFSGGTDITARTETTASAAWNDVNAPNAGNTLTSPDLSTIVQEIVDRSGWADGNNMALFINSASGDQRDVQSHDNDAADAPILNVWYTTLTGTGSAGTDQLVGVRFSNLNIPQGATINSAYIDFQVGTATTDTTSLKIAIEDADNAEAFTSASENISNRTPAGSVTWAPGSWNTVGEVQQSPDLSTLLQTVVSRTGWCGGNAAAFVIAGSGRRIAYSYDNDPSTAPVLRVNFTPATTPGCAAITATSQVESSNDDAEQRPGGSMRLTSDDLELMYDGGLQEAVGVRFTDVTVPQGATVIDAYIRFTTDEANGTYTCTDWDDDECDGEWVLTGPADPINLTIYGEDEDNANSYGSGDDNISGRTQTSNSVAWDNIAGWDTVGETHNTPSLTDIVQEIVDRTNWSSGNAMAFMFEAGASGCSDSDCVRYAESYDGNVSGAPRLVIEYQGTAAQGTIRDDMIDTVATLTAQDWTPIVDTLYEAARYYRGEQVYYGRTRGAGESYSGTSSEENHLSSAEHTRVSHSGSYSGTATLVRGSVSNPITIDVNDVCYSDPSDVDCRYERITSTHNYISNISHECQPNYIVLLSDGRANNNHSTTLVPTMTGGSCGGSVISELSSSTLDPTGSMRNPTSGEMCGVELVDYLNTEDQSSTVGGDNTIQTFTIGFNLNSGSDQDAIEFLHQLADTGDGAYYEASSSADLVDAFENIIQTIQKESTSFVAPGLSINAFNRLFNLPAVYLALFEPAKSVGWYGNVKKYALCDELNSSRCEFGELIDVNGDPAVVTDEQDTEFGNLQSNSQGFWSGTGDDGLAVIDGGAGEKVPTYTDRKLYIYTSTDDPDPSSNPTGVSLHLVDDTTDTGSDTSTALKQRLLEAGNCGGTATPDNSCLNNLLLWMLGKRFDTDSPVGSTSVDRWAFADPMHSRPAVVAYSAVACTSTDVADSDSDCFGGTAGDPNGDKPISKLFVGTNDGGIRMIDEHTGIEELMIVPQETLAIQETLKDNNNGDHEWGMDGSATLRIYDCDDDGIIDPTNADSEDCNFDGSVNDDDKDFVHMYIGMRRGGRNLYAYNITPSSKLTSQGETGKIIPKLLWRIEGGVTTGFSKLGQTWSTPKPTRIQTASGVQTVLIFAGGYDPNQDEGNWGTDGMGNAIYIVDADDGSLLWSVSNDGSGATLEITEMQYSMPADVALVDSTGDTLTNRLYIADVGGQVWRVDLASTLSNSTAGRLAVLGQNGQPNQRKFFYQPEVALVTDNFFTGEAARDYDAVSLSSGDRAEPNDTKQRDRVYTLRDYLIDDVITLDLNNDPENYPACNPDANCSVPLNHGDLMDVTDDIIVSADDDPNANNEPIDYLKGSHGWYFNLEANDQSNGNKGGEKGFSKATTVNGITFFTTFVPSTAENQTVDDCNVQVGGSRLYAVDLFTGAPVFADFNGLSELQETDRYRSLGTGPSGRLLPVFLEQGTTGLIPTGAGGLSQDLGDLDLIRKTFWYQQQ